MQKNEDVTATLSRARSNLMRQTLFAMNIQTDTLIFNREEYRIIDSNFRNWISSDKHNKEDNFHIDLVGWISVIKNYFIVIIWKYPSN